MLEWYIRAFQTQWCQGKKAHCVSTDIVPIVDTFPKLVVIIVIEEINWKSFIIYWQIGNLWALHQYYIIFLHSTW